MAHQGHEVRNTLGEYTYSTMSRYASKIIRLLVAANNFETNLYFLVLCNKTSLEGGKEEEEDQNLHIAKFGEICDTIIK